MSSIPAGKDVLDAQEPVYDLPTVSELLRIPVTKIHQYLREGQLMAVRRNGIPVVPQVFFSESGQVAKALPGLLAVLRDGGYDDGEILRWLFTADPSLVVTRDGAREPVPNARPIDALHSHQAREVLRRAQAMGY
ncbi:MAG: Rv2175c family DNA-binding protein [Mycobacterium sp.]